MGNTFGNRPACRYSHFLAYQYAQNIGFSAHSASQFQFDLHLKTFGTQLYQIFALAVLIEQT